MSQYHNIDFIQLTDDGFEEFIQYQLRNPTLREIDLKVDLHSTEKYHFMPFIFFLLGHIDLRKGSD